jgi:drug/metabolite transporter (DMT)-like permease
LSDWQPALAAFGIGVLGYLPPLAFVHGIKISRVGIVSAISSTAPFFTILLSVIWLGTHLHSIQWWGVALIIAANTVISINFQSIRDSNILKLASGVPYGLIAAVLWGLVYFLIIYPTRAIGPLLSALMLELGVAAAAGIHLLVRKESLMVRQAATWPIVSNGLLIMGGTLSYTIGVAAFHVGVVAALANSTAAVSIIAAGLLHHERLVRGEKILAALMVAGVILISIIQ